eukprot:3656160-Rhodomonas_salina.1
MARSEDASFLTKAAQGFGSKEEDTGAGDKAGAPPARTSPSMIPVGHRHQMMAADGFSLGGNTASIQAQSRHGFVQEYSPDAGAVSEGAWRMPSHTTVSPHLQYSL